MKGAVLALRKPKGRDPTRDALAGVQNELLGLVTIQQKARAVVDRAKNLREQTSERNQAASEAALSAREDHAEAMLRSARTGDAVVLASSSRELRIAAADAADDLAAATSALASAEQALSQAEYDVDRVGAAVNAACDAVFIESFPAYLEALRADRDALFRRCSVLQYVRGLKTCPPDVRQRAESFLENVRVLLLRDSPMAPGYPPVDEWEATRSALINNPDVPLPPIGGVL